MDFLDVKTDFAFKRVFGSEQSKAILIDFLKAVIDFGDAGITDLTTESKAIYCARLREQE